jgi:NAD(P)H-dependent FMN reductase
VIVLGSPVYIGSMPGIMKTFFDRHNGLAVFNPDDALELYQLPWLAKARRLRAEVKRFGARYDQMRGRGFVLVTTSTLPFPYSMLTGQTRLALRSLEALPVRMNGRVLAKLVYTDTLFRFRPGKRDHKLRQAYRIGRRVAGWAGARRSADQ